MRMIVDAFTESLEIGLESPGQVVVSAIAYLIALHAVSNRSLTPEGFPRSSL